MVVTARGVDRKCYSENMAVKTYYRYIENCTTPEKIISSNLELLCMVKLNDAMEKILDVSEETNDDIIKSLKANSEANDVFIAIIAPYVGVKVTPSKIKSASMGISEEFGIESVIEEIKERESQCDNLYILINSPGGLVSSSYKVARALRKNFKEIVVFVPHIAASGGTLISLIGNKIVMGMMSQLTPLDPQTGDGSALNIVRGHRNVTNYFSDRSEMDAPYSYKVLAEKFDASQLDSAHSALDLMTDYVSEILAASGYESDKISDISSKLVKGFKTHQDVINLDSAKKIGLNAVDYTEYPKLWEISRQWLGIYLLKSADKHVIRYWINGGDTCDGTEES